MFSGFWAILGQPLFIGMLIVSIVSGIVNALQYGKSKIQQHQIEALQEDLTKANTAKAAALSQAETTRIQCERLAKYYENMPVKKHIDGDVDPDDIIKWLRNQTSSDQLSSGGQTDHTKPAEDTRQ